jgi:hypothetical protein
MPKINNKEKILKSARERCQRTYKGKHIRSTSVLLAQTLKARKSWINIIQALRK